MRLAELSPGALTRSLGDGTLLVRVGPFAVRLQSPFDSVRDYLQSHYGDFFIDSGSGAHFAIRIASPSPLRTWIRPQAIFAGDGYVPFHPLPAEMAPALLEWGFNWCVARRAQHLMVIHSAVVSRNDQAVLMPAPPESGKSTLCAALVANGWRLGSDEFALFATATGVIHPIPRPISLKEASIAIINGRWANARFGPEVLNPEGTRVRYLRPPETSVTASQRPLRARWVVVPRYRAGSDTVLAKTSHAHMLAHLADSSYNFTQFGPPGFESLAAMIDGVDSYTLTYSNLDEALALFDRLEIESRP